MADQPEQLSDVPSGAEYLETARTNYFTGQFLTARDLARDQGYHVARRRLHQRLLHGWGVVCGLNVCLRDDVSAACKGFSVAASPGLALDCQGRDLILAEPRYLDLRQLPSEDDSCDTSQSMVPFLLCADYTVEGAEEVPVLYADGRRSATNWNQLQESITFVKRTRLKRECWPDLWANPQGLALPESNCDKSPVKGNCLGPQCDCGNTVPLALVVPQIKEEKLIGYEVYTCGRRLIPHPLLPQDLTHIRDTTWKHGMPMSLCDLRDKFHWTLRIHFDRPLCLSPGAGRGVSEQTFLVNCTDPADSRRLLRLPGHACTTDEGLTAEFTIRHDCHLDDLIRGWSHHKHSPTIGVTLRCDFIPDKNKRALDGNFIQEQFPTGDGVAGGTFESWFELTI